MERLATSEGRPVALEGRSLLRALVRRSWPAGRHRAVAVAALLAVLALVGPFYGVARSSRASAQARPAANELVTVVDFGGSDKLLVQNDDGLMYKVQYIGVRGPVRSSILNGGAAAFHAQLVLGQRVFLESDGKDEEQGYKLRHAYLEGNPVPLGAIVVGAGWATAVPYPLDHRQYGLYLQAQEQAMAQQVNFWQPGIFGPAAPWRPAGAADGYVAADPQLHGILDLLYTVPTGQSVLDRLVRMGILVVLRDDIPGGAGTTEALGNHIELNARVLQFDPHVMAVIIVHEGTHAVDHTAAAMDLANFSCFEMEQRAYGIEANTWAEYYGPAGKPDPKDDGERSENNILGFAQRGDLENFVRRSPAYERQCAGERVPG